jgi:hypothetical protein
MQTWVENTKIISVKKPCQVGTLRKLAIQEGEITNIFPTQNLVKSLTTCTSH